MGSGSSKARKSKPSKWHLLKKTEEWSDLRERPDVPRRCERYQVATSQSDTHVVGLVAQVGEHFTDTIINGLPSEHVNFVKAKERPAFGAEPPSDEIRPTSQSTNAANGNDDRLKLLDFDGDEIEVDSDLSLDSIGVPAAEPSLPQPIFNADVQTPPDCVASDTNIPAQKNTSPVDITTQQNGSMENLMQCNETKSTGAANILRHEKTEPVRIQFQKICGVYRPVDSTIENDVETIDPSGRNTQMNGLADNYSATSTLTSIESDQGPLKDALQSTVPLRGPSEELLPRYLRQSNTVASAHGDLASKDTPNFGFRSKIDACEKNVVAEMRQSGIIRVSDVAQHRNLKTQEIMKELEYSGMIGVNNTERGEVGDGCQNTGVNTLPSARPPPRPRPPARLKPLERP